MAGGPDRRASWTVRARWAAWAPGVRYLRRAAAGRYGRRPMWGATSGDDGGCSRRDRPGTTSKETTMSIHADPLFITTEVERRLELAGVAPRRARPRAGPRRPRRPPLRGRRGPVRPLRGAATDDAEDVDPDGDPPASAPVTAVATVAGAMIGAVPPRPVSSSSVVTRRSSASRPHSAPTARAARSSSAATPASGRPPSSGRLVARAGDRRVLVGHCVGEVGTSLPYLPFVEVFAGLDARERALVDDLVEAHPGLVPLVPRLAAGARGDAVRADLVEAVHGALTDLGRRGPGPLVVEDVHWADESTRELLTLLFTRGGPDGVGLLATYRSDDVHRRHPLTAALAVWSRLPGLTRVDLGPLPDAAVGRIVRRGGEALSPRVVDDLVRRAEGNAFFAEELAAAVRSGARDAEDLQRLLLARVDQLSEAAQGVVRVAAVVGRRVPHVLLERVAGVEPAVLRDALRAAVEHHVLEPWGDRGYEFRHALLAEAVLDDLLPHERLQLHRACADALLEDPALGSEADLARHALASGDRDLALTAAVRAGDSARRMGGPAEALAHYEAALGLLGRGPPAARDTHDATTSPSRRPPPPTRPAGPCAPPPSCAPGSPPVTRPRTSGPPSSAGSPSPRG